MQTILQNGPTTNRFNVVVLAEGYTSSQSAKFLADATNAINGLLARAPYQEYQSYFNAYAIFVASSQSGSDHPVSSTYRNTYFYSTYDSVSDLLITIPPNWQDTHYSHGQGKIDDLLRTNMPACNLAILLVNDTIYGGSDGFGKTAIASIAPSSQDILVHETGHVVAGLGDEYEYAYPGFPDTEEPNTTRETRRDFIKWRAWISSDTPIPTPATADYASTVGLFEGAHYHSTNWYRPQLDCAMRSFSVPFCAVCSEALVLAIYQKVRPVDAFSPASTKLSVTTAQTISFSTTLLQPATHALGLQWLMDNTAVAGATGAVYNLSPQTLSNGTHTVVAVVRDYTSLVRTDSSNHLSQTITWTLNVDLPQMRLDSARWLSGGKFAFRVTGNATQPVVIQGGTNLSNWTALATNSLASGSFWYTNTMAGSSSKKFFRTVTTP